jgi:hypothetical protein
MQIRQDDEVLSYTGYNFISGDGCPTGLTIQDQLEAALNDKIDTLVVVRSSMYVNEASVIITLLLFLSLQLNQNGAQMSASTIGVVYDDISTYFSNTNNVNKWEDGRIIGVNDYSQSEEFNTLVVAHTLEALSKFSGSTPQNTCIMFACHGVSIFMYFVIDIRIK